MVETDRDNDVTKWWFSISGEKCQVCDVTLVGGRVAITSGFRFPVGLYLYCSNCGKDLVGNYYFWSGERRKIAKQYFGAIFWQFFFASLACHTGCPHGGRPCAPLPTTKFEPLSVGSDRVISAWTWWFSVFRISGVSGKHFFSQKWLMDLLFLFCAYVLR